MLCKLFLYCETNLLHVPVRISPCQVKDMFYVIFLDKKRLTK